MSEKQNMSSRRLLKHAIQGLALGVTAGAIIFWCSGAGEAAQAISRLPWYVAAIPALMILCSWMCNGGRFWLLCRAVGHRLPYPKALAISLSTEFGVAATPAGAGGTAIRLLFLQRAGLPMASGASLLAMDAAIDLFFFILLVPVTLVVMLKDPAWLRTLRLFPESASRSWASGLAMIVTLIGLAWVVPRLRRRLLDWVHMSSLGRKRRLPARIRYWTSKSRRSWKQIKTTTVFLLKKKPGYLVGDFLLAVVQWFCRYGVLPVIVLAYEPTRNPLPLILIQGTLLFLSLVVVAPGGGGGVEVTTPFVLRQFIDAPAAALVMFLWRFFTYYLYLIAGGSVFFWTYNHLDKLGAESATSPFQTSEPQPDAIAT